MKKAIIITIILQFAVLCIHAQVGSIDYTNAIYDYSVSDYKILKDRMKDTITLRRFETGLLTRDGSSLYGATSRKLFKGNRYLVLAYTDSRIKDFHLYFYVEKNAKWDLLNDIHKGTRSGSYLIGNYEMGVITVPEDGIYRFLVNSTDGGDAGRYGIMVYSVSAADQTTAPTTASTNGTVFNTDYYQVANYNSADKKFGSWGDKKTTNLIITLNSDETMFTSRMSTGSTSSKYYVQSKKEGNSTYYDFEVLDADGKKLSFYIPKGSVKDGFFQVFNFNDPQNIYVYSYHFTSP